MHRFSKLAGSLLLSATAFLGVTAASTPARAANAACNVLKVEYYQGTVLIQCTGATPSNYLAQTTPPAGCGAHAQTLETQKIWLSMAQAALLSGKPMWFYYTACGGLNLLNVVDFGIDRF